jgi:3-carboxy-cis,cis-muconate cycloisomerase
MFDALFSAPAVVEATDGRAWVRAMLDVEAALARAVAAVGLAPPAAADAIVAACGTDLVDPDELGRAAVASATPVVPLVAALRAAVPADAAAYVHLGATSQDVVDTAMMLVTGRALAPIDADLAACAARLGALAGEHRDTPQQGRTLGQQAEPTTFGAVCAGWLSAVDDARAGLARTRRTVQLGGAVGTLSAYGGHGSRVAQLVAEDLGLAPSPPWHTDRGRVAELAAALGVTAGALAKMALDVILLAQTEIGEVSEGEGGASSAMPHKRNPARAVLVTACAHRAPGLVGTVLAAMPQELQRAAGRWQSEWPTLTDLLRLVGGAAAHSRAMLAGLRVDPARMAANLRRTP